MQEPHDIFEEKSATTPADLHRRFSTHLCPRTTCRHFEFPFFFLAGLVAVMPFSPLHAQQPTYIAIDLGTLGGSNSGALAINSSGEIVGYSQIPGNSAYHATCFGTAGGNNTDLGTLGGPNSYACGINDSGQIAGMAQTSGATSRATIFSCSGRSNIGLGPQGGPSSKACAINTSDQVVGDSKISGDTTRATLFNGTDNTNTDLGTLGGSNSETYAINASGQIVGSADTSDGAFRATLFGCNGGANTDLGTLGGSNSAAYAINASGQIVGTAQTPGGTYHATLFSSGGGNNTDLGTLGGANSEAYAINASGQIVGMAQTSGTSAWHAFLFTNGTMLDLNAITAGATNISINSIGSPINDWGQIVARGAVNGKTHALLLNPTTPSVSNHAGVTSSKFVAGMTYTKFAALARKEGFRSTVAFLGGMAGSGGNGACGRNRNVKVGFAEAAAGLSSDIVELDGTVGAGFADIIVLSVSYDEATATSLSGGEATLRLGRFDPITGQWTLAVDGNAGGTPFFAGNRAFNPATDFHLGTHGVDTAKNTVWAVINHNSQFGAIPCPPRGFSSFSPPHLSSPGKIKHHKTRGSIGLSH